MKENREKVKLLARDLRNSGEFPRSPRETLGSYVLAALAVDKCRAVLVGRQGEYHSSCRLDQKHSLSPYSARRAIHNPHKGAIR